MGKKEKKVEKAPPSDVVGISFYLRNCFLDDKMVDIIIINIIIIESKLKLNFDSMILVFIFNGNSES